MDNNSRHSLSLSNDILHWSIGITAHAEAGRASISSPDHKAGMSKRINTSHDHDSRTTPRCARNLHYMFDTFLGSSFGNANGPSKRAPRPHRRDSNIAQDYCRKARPLADFAAPQTIDIPNNGPNHVHIHYRLSAFHSASTSRTLLYDYCLGVRHSLATVTQHCTLIFRRW